MCNEAPLSTMYIPSSLCIAKPFAVSFACVGIKLLKKFIRGDPCGVLFVFKISLSSLYDLCLTNYSCTSFHSVDLRWYDGAFGDLPFLLSVWITFRDGNVSLNFALSRL